MNNLIGTFVSVWAKPWAAMEQVKQQPQDASIKPAMVFILVMGSISGLITSIMGIVLPAEMVGTDNRALAWLALPIIPTVSFIGSFIGAFIIWWLVDGILTGTKPQYKTSYRLLALLAAFSPVSALLAPIPVAGQWIAIVINLWATIVMIRGIVIVRETPTVRTWVTCILFFGALFALGVLARVSTQDQLNQADTFGTGDFGDSGADDLEEQLDDLAKPASPAPAGGR